MELFFIEYEIDYMHSQEKKRPFPSNAINTILKNTI